MKIGIMQPYFLPYIGYFQLIQAVDQFVIYDDVQFIKSGFINRNRYLMNGEATYFGLSVKDASFTQVINERYFTEQVEREWKKLIKAMQLTYSRAPYFKEGMTLLENIGVPNVKEPISLYITHSIATVCTYLGIATPFITSSSIKRTVVAKNEARVIDTVKRLGGDAYMNAYGGYELYDTDHFAKEHIALSFLKPNLLPYKQFNHPFVSHLSIIDVIMFNSQEAIKHMLEDYEVVIK